MTLIYLGLILLRCSPSAFSQIQSNQNNIFSATETIANSQLQDQQKNGRIDAALVDQLIANKVSEQDGDCKAESVFSKTPEPQKEKKGDNFEIVAVVEVASPVKEQLINDMNPNYDLSWYNIGQKYGNKYLCLENYVDLISSSNLKYNQFDSNLAAVKSSFYSSAPSGAPLQLNGKPAEYINVFTDDGSMAPMLLPKAEMDAGAKDGFFVALLNATVAQKFQSGQTPSAEDDQTAIQEVASIINSHYSSDADRMRILSLYADQLYNGYNNARNPFGNNASNNPKKLPLPSGTIGLTQLAYSATTYNQFLNGGVCNDIASAVGMVAKKMFPGRDVLTVEESGFGGSQHFGTLISDGKTTSVISGGETTSYDAQKSSLQLWDDYHQSMNTRIQKIGDDGKLSDVFLGKTPYGAFIEKITDPNSPYYVQNGKDFSSQLATFREALPKNRGLTAGVGVAELNDQSQVVAIFAKINGDHGILQNQNSNSFTVQHLPDGTAIRVHIDEGFMLKKILYQHPNVKFDGELGAKAEVVGGVFVPNHGSGEVTFDGDLGVNAGFHVNVKSPNQKTAFDASLNQNLQVGSRSYGNMESGSGAAALKYLSLFPNQTLFQANLTQAFTSKLSGTGDLKYQGTAVGQNLSGKLGLTVQAPSNVVVSTFVGYTQKFKGFNTNYNYLVQNPGGMDAGASVKVKNATIGVEGDGIGTSEQQYNLKALVPISIQKKPKPIPMSN